MSFIMDVFYEDRYDVAHDELLPLGCRPDVINEEFWAAAHYPEGIRLVLQAEDRGRALEDDIARLLEGRVQLRKLFPDYEGEAIDGVRLEDFWLLTIPEARIGGNFRNAFNLAHALREELGLITCEPDLPFAHAAPETEDDEADCQPRADSADPMWALDAMNVPAVWNTGNLGEGVLIGHPDTGWATHDELDDDRLAHDAGYNFVERGQHAEDPLKSPWYVILDQPGHGTSTASVIAGGKAGRISGVAPQARLAPIRTSRFVYWTFASPLAEAILHAHRAGCDVISISMGGTSLSAIEAALNKVVAEGRIVVAAGGNAFNGVFVTFVVFPAAYRACIALAATNAASQPWTGSYSGPYIDISAPGECVWHARRKEKDSRFDVIKASCGTSFATAHAAGAAALWLAKYRAEAGDFAQYHGATMQELFRNCLKTSARVPDTGWAPTRYGAGILDVEQLVGQVYRNCLPEDTQLTQTPYRELIGQYLGIRANEKVAEALARLFDAQPADLDAELMGWGHEVLYCLMRGDQFDPGLMATIRRGFDHEPNVPDLLRMLIAQFGSQRLIERVRA